MSRGTGLSTFVLLLIAAVLSAIVTVIVGLLVGEIWWRGSVIAFVLIMMFVFLGFMSAKRR